MGGVMENSTKKVSAQVGDEKKATLDMLIIQLRDSEEAAASVKNILSDPGQVHAALERINDAKNISQKILLFQFSV